MIPVSHQPLRATPSEADVTNQKPVNSFVRKAVILICYLQRTLKETPLHPIPSFSNIRHTPTPRKTHSVLNREKSSSKPEARAKHQETSLFVGKGSFKNKHNRRRAHMAILTQGFSRMNKTA